MLACLHALEYALGGLGLDVLGWAVGRELGGGSRRAQDRGSG